MKNHFPFDEHFKDKLQDIESFVPEDMFERVMSERAKRRSLTIFLPLNVKYWIAAGVSGAVLGIFLIKPAHPTVPVQGNVPSQAIVSAAPAVTMVPKTTESIAKISMLPAVDSKAAVVPAQSSEKALLAAISMPEKALTTLVAAQEEVKNENIQPLPMRDLTAIEATEVKKVDIDVQEPLLYKKKSSNKSSASWLNLSSWLKNTLQHSATGPDGSCPDFNLRRPKRLYVDVWGAPDYAFRRLYDKQGETNTYAQARDSVEKSWYGVSAGARLSLVLENGIAIRAGVNYLQNNEKFDLKKPGEVRIITTTESITLPDGTKQSRTFTEKQTGTYQWLKYNRYRSLDIPLQVGYEFGSMPWVFSVNGGVNFNITSWRKAHILNPALQIMDASSSEAGVFKNNVGLSLYASVAAYYNLTYRAQIFAEPFIRHGLSSITSKDYLLEQRYTSAGLKLGFRWQL